MLQTRSNLLGSEMNLGGAVGSINDYQTYRVMGTIGRRYQQRLIGPAGQTRPDEDQTVSYDATRGGKSLLPDGESPATMVKLLEFALPAPTKVGPTNLSINVSGAVETSNAPGASQFNRVDIYSKNAVFADSLLERVNVFVAIPQGAWNGLLIPYSANVNLFLDANGNLAGANGTSGKNPAQVYQFLVDQNVSSGTITVP